MIRCFQSYLQGLLWHDAFLFIFVNSSKGYEKEYTYIAANSPLDAVTCKCIAKILLRVPAKVYHFCRLGAIARMQVCSSYVKWPNFTRIVAISHLDAAIEIHSDEVARVSCRVVVAHDCVDLECPGPAILDIVPFDAPPVHRQHEQCPQRQHGDHADTQEH